MTRGLCLLLLAGCVGSDPAVSTPAADAGDDASPGASCAKRSGTFVSSFTEKVGTCGAYRTIAGSDDQTETYAYQPSAPSAPCAGAFTYSANNCAQTIETSCPSTDPGTTLTTRGTLTWNESGTKATGDLEVSTSKCKSTYAVVTSKK